MSKILKHVPVFFFLLAGLTLSAHMLIPHDHHIAEQFSSRDNNCPVQNNESGHKSGFPTHCHAFNDLAAEKLRVLHLSNNFQFSFTFISIISCSDTPDLEIFCLGRIDFQKSVMDPHALELTLLRAPPSLV